MQANADICTQMKHFMQIACKSETTLSGFVRSLEPDSHSSGRPA